MSIWQAVRSGVGPRALIVAPNGSAALVTLPAEPAAMAAALHEAVGGFLHAPVAGADWVAYAADDADERGEPANMLAGMLAGALGSLRGPLLIGVVAFLGREGPNEVDVPERLLALADPGVRPGPRPGMRLRLRLLIGGEVADEVWFGGGKRVNGEQVARHHADLIEQANNAGQTWQVEAYEPERAKRRAMAPLRNRSSGHGATDGDHSRPAGSPAAIRQLTDQSTTGRDQTTMTDTTRPRLTLITGGLGHEIMPDPATVTRERDGEPGSILDPSAYPLRRELLGLRRPDPLPIVLRRLAARRARRARSPEARPADDNRPRTPTSPSGSA